MLLLGEIRAVCAQPTELGEKRAMKLRQFGVVIPTGVGMLLSMSVAAQGSIAPDRPVFIPRPSFEPTMMRLDPYADETDALPGLEPYSCYRVRRCSAHDLYYFADRPNRLTRLAAEAPPQTVAGQDSVPYVWVFAPVTPEENILPSLRRTSQVRDEYRAVGRPIDDPN